ncbi:MAG: flagellar biosynthesis protein FlhF [Phycisphaeraceae bacterium]|nr:flagellar biosynthesis protein FlhF [Phycisphaeraceae bacterium]
MNIRTFTANKMSEALAKVKRELGAGAVILHTRRYRRSGLIGWIAAPVVEVTAADHLEIGRLRQRSRTTSRVTSAGKQVKLNAGEPRDQVSQSSSPQPSTAGELIRRTYAAAKTEIAQQMSTDSSRADIHPPNNDRLVDEMRAVKRMVTQMMHNQPPSSDANVLGSSVPPSLFDQYMALLEQEVCEELAQDVIKQVATSGNVGACDKPELLRRVLLETMAQYILTDDDSEKIATHHGGLPRTIALIGPTGVGKTTTIAKLAADFKLRQKKDVSLITVDTYRIAAVEQLQTYADIIGVPLHVASNPDQILAAMRQCSDCDLVLIDTAGRSQRDDPKLEQLASVIRAANPDEVHLVLASTCTQKVIFDTIERFAHIPADRLIFTKLDEAVSFGVLFNVMRKVNKRLSYITTGQEVPHQIEPGHPSRLAALVLDGDLAPATALEMPTSQLPTAVATAL